MSKSELKTAVITFEASIKSLDKQHARFLTCCFASHYNIPMHEPKEIFNARFCIATATLRMMQLFHGHFDDFWTPSKPKDTFDL